MPSSRIGYGYGAYSDADFGVEGVTQTGSASASVASAATCTGAHVKESSGATSASALPSSACVRIRASGALVSSTASTASVGEEFVLKLSSQYDYGDGAYGYASYGQGPLQTTLAGSAATDSTAIRVREASASVSASASTSSAVVTVADGVTTIRATSTNTATGSFSVVGAATAECVATVTVNVIRRVKSGALISVTSSTAAVAREKWEPIATTPETWVTIPTTSETWTKVA